MNPAEAIYFSFIACICVIVIAVIWILFRKRKKIALIVTAVIVAGYIGYYVSYPMMKEYQHATSFEQLQVYLKETYPGQVFTVESEHYEAGLTVGEFEVNRVETPNMGVTLRVKNDGQVVKVSTWSAEPYPIQQELWRQINMHRKLTYTLDQDLEESMLSIEQIDEIVLQD